MPSSHKTLKRLLLTYGVAKTAWPKGSSEQFKRARQSAALKARWQEEETFESLLTAVFDKERQTTVDTMTIALQERILKQAWIDKNKSLKTQWQELWKVVFPKQGWFWSLASCLSIIFLLFYVQLSLSRQLEETFLEKQDFTEEVGYFLGAALIPATMTFSKTTPTLTTPKQKK